MLDELNILGTSAFILEPKTFHVWQSVTLLLLAVYLFALLSEYIYLILRYYLPLMVLRYLFAMYPLNLVC